MRKGFYINIYKTDGLTKERNFFIPSFLIKLFIILSGFVFIWVIFTTYFLFKKFHGQRKLAYYTYENERLRNKIEKLEKKTDQMKEKMAILLREQNKFRKYLDFKPIDEEILSMPIGGFPDEEKKTSLLEQKLDYLLNIAEKQEKETRELKYFLERDEVLRRRTPSISPVNGGYITSKFEWRIDPFTGRKKFHKGVDIAGAKGTPVFATADGVVKYSGWRKGYGLTVEVDHGNGFVTIYAHNEKNLVRTGDRIKRGDMVALMGRTGKTTGVHVHYEIRLFGKAVNPLLYVIPDTEYFD